MRQGDSLESLQESGEGTRLTALNQPPARLKTLGWAKKKMLREVLQTSVPKTEAVKKLAKLYGLGQKEMSLELAIVLAQSQKALDGDTNAFRALMERAYGYPVTPIATKTDSHITLEIVYGSKPINVVESGK
jgi:hypothetical protein